jgi:hypothetical protein
VLKSFCVEFFFVNIFDLRADFLGPLSDGGGGGGGDVVDVVV